VGADVGGEGVLLLGLRRRLGVEDRDVERQEGEREGRGKNELAPGICHDHGGYLGERRPPEVTSSLSKRISMAQRGVAAVLMNPFSE
jgi:hypothetical protein